MERETKIEVQQARFLAHLLSTGNIERACKASKIGKAKAYGWLREESFQQELKTRRAEMVDSALELLQGASVEAVTRLRELLHCGKASTEARAAIAILEAAIKAKELGELERRITALERITEGRITNGQGHRTAH